jgi:hypothetical protein
MVRTARVEKSNWGNGKKGNGFYQINLTSIRVGQPLSFSIDVTFGLRK